MNTLALKLENVENLVSSHFTVKWRRRTLSDESIDFHNCLRGEKSGSLCLCGFHTLWARPMWVGPTSAPPDSSTCQSLSCCSLTGCWNGSVVETLEGPVQTMTPPAPNGASPSAPRGASSSFSLWSYMCMLTCANVCETPFTHAHARIILPW